MKLDFRQRLLATTLLVGASAVATPAFAQDTNPNTNPPDTSAVPTIPQTTAPVEGTPVPSTSATGEPVKRAQDSIVTGSRIPQPNLESASPVTVVTSQEVKVSGTTRTEDLINSLPQVFATQGSNISNGASGTATIDLRGLGSKRSLVLVNGKRLQAGDTGNPVADINFVPAVMIKRVDVLTGGASSVYGADAVAGVVNFIMDTTFTGFRIDGQASVFNHKNRASQDIIDANTDLGFLPPRGWSTNGGAQDIAGVFGAAFDDGRGHVTAYATYRTQDPVLQSSRDYSFCALTGLVDEDPRAVRFPGDRPDVKKLGRNFNCSGSLTSATGTFLQYDPNDQDGNGKGDFRLIDVAQVQGNGFVNYYTAFNFNPYNYFQRPDERYTFGAFADYEISPAFKPYAELMFMDDRSDAQIAPSGDFGNTNALACDNALLTAAQRDRLCGTYDAKLDTDHDPDTPPVLVTGLDPTFVGSLNGMANVQQTFTYILRRNVEGGGRDDDIRHTDYRLVGGLRGDAARGISYDAYYQFGRTLRNETYFNDFSVTRLGRAIDAIAVDPNTGLQVAPGTPGAEIMCRAAFTGIDPDCIPYNIFQAGAVNLNALNYLQTPGFQRGEIHETIAHADFTINGDEYGWRMPWAETGIGINVGAEYRKESLDFKVDQAFESGDLAGQGGPTPPVSGQFDVRELFGEVQLPIVEHNFIDQFTITGGYRYSNYHVAGNSFNTDTYKLQAELAPIRDIRFRGSYNRAVRAPNIVELFFPTSLALSGTVDPCATATPTATQEQCALTGVSAIQYGNVSKNPANQYNGLFGGNPDLTPEKADTWTAGVVIQPRFVPGLALTADYFNIKVKNLIGSPSFSSVLNGCMGTGGATQDLTLCPLIHRNTATGSLWQGADLDTAGYIILRNRNFTGTGLFTKGFDFQGNYSRRLGGVGTLNLSFVGTLVTKLGSPTDSQPGTFAGSTPSPKWRHTLRAGLTMPNGLGLSVRWRHFSGVNCDYLVQSECSVTIDPDGDPDTDNSVRHPIPGNERLSAQDYFDLTLTARLAQRLNLRIGANNIFDRDPPLAGSQAVPAGFGNGNTYPQVYDALGRYLFAGFTVDF
jgi:outer membrane receptor protein involved in Fe transport